MALRIKWLGTACFEILLPTGKTLVIDPYVDDSVSVDFKSDIIEGCDYIFITHGHYDHVLDVGKLASRFRPKIFGNAAVSEALIKHQAVDPALVTRITVGDKVQEPGLTVEAVKGIHVDIAGEFKRISGRDMPVPGAALSSDERKLIGQVLGFGKRPPQLGEWMAKYPAGEQLNFIFEIIGGRRIYMAGSYPDPRLESVFQSARADITLMQVMNGHLLRGLEERTAAMALSTGARVIVPQHHDPLMEGSPLTDLTGLRQLIEKSPGVTFLELTPGQWYDLASR